MTQTRHDQTHDYSVLNSDAQKYLGDFILSCSKSKLLCEVSKSFYSLFADKRLNCLAVMMKKIHSIYIIDPKIKIESAVGRQKYGLIFNPTLEDNSRDGRMLNYLNMPANSILHLSFETYSDDITWAARYFVDQLFFQLKKQNYISNVPIDIGYQPDDVKYHRWRNSNTNPNDLKEYPDITFWGIQYSINQSCLDQAITYIQSLGITSEECDSRISLQKILNKCTII